MQTITILILIFMPLVYGSIAFVLRYRDEVTDIVGGDKNKSDMVYFQHRDIYVIEMVKSVAFGIGHMVSMLISICITMGLYGLEGCDILMDNFCGKISIFGIVLYAMAVIWSYRELAGTGVEHYGNTRYVSGVVIRIMEGAGMVVATSILSYIGIQLGI